MRPSQTAIRPQAALLLTGLLLLTSGCGTVRQLGTPVHLLTSISPLLALPVTVAQAQGDFAAEHLLLQVTPGSRGRLPGLLARATSALALAGPGTAFSAPGGWSLVGSVAVRDPTVLLGRTADPRFIWSSLRHKILLPEAGGSARLLRYILRQHRFQPGVNPAFLAGLGRKAFLAGTGDFLQESPVPALRLQQEKKAFPVARLTVDGGPFQSGALLAGPMVGSGILRRFLTALYQGERFVQTARVAVLGRILHPDYPQVPLSLLTGMIREMRHAGMWAPDPRPLPQLLWRTYRILSSEQGMPLRLPVDLVAPRAAWAVYQSPLPLTASPPSASGR